MAGFDQALPGQLRIVCSAKTLDPEMPAPETLARELDDGTSATGESALHWRSGVVAKVRVLTS